MRPSSGATAPPGHASRSARSPGTLAAYSTLPATTTDRSADRTPVRPKLAPADRQPPLAPRGGEQAARISPRGWHHRFDSGRRLYWRFAPFCGRASSARSRESARVAWTGCGCGGSLRPRSYRSARSQITWPGQCPRELNSRDRDSHLLHPYFTHESQARHTPTRTTGWPFSAPNSLNCGTVARM